MKTTRVETLTQNLTELATGKTTRRSLVTLLVGGLLAASVATAPETEARRRGGWGGGRRRPQRPCWGRRRPCWGRPPGPPYEGGVTAPPLVLPPLVPPAPICIATGTVCPATCAPGEECAACCGGVCNANGACGTPA
jgi:hypothetical protein